MNEQCKQQVALFYLSEPDCFGAEGQAKLGTQMEKPDHECLMARRSLMAVIAFERA